MRIDQLINNRNQRQQEPDYSLLTDKELDDLIELMEKSGAEEYEPGVPLPMLSDGENQQLETITQKLYEV